MKKKMFIIIVIVVVNLGFAIHGKVFSSDVGSVKINQLVFSGSGGGEKIWTKDFCNCFLGGDDSNFKNFCGSTWKCESGTDLETCTDHPGCTTGCSCVN